ncbi:MAG: histidinol-phosphatase [Pirellulaceae bacterium]
MEPLLYETHSHTPLCRHAIGDPGDYAEVAAHRGLRGLMVTCHNPMPDGFAASVRMAPEQFADYLDLVDRARRTWAGRLDVQLGLEADYFPGHEGWLERQLRSAVFQYVLGSVHPHLREYRQRCWQGDPIAFQRAYFRSLAEAAETGLFDCLAHPDIVKNETAAQWRPARIMDDICLALDRIAAAGVAMELNTSGANKAIPEMNPGPEILVEMRRRSIPVVIGSDAHDPWRVGDRFEEALDILSQCGYSHVSYFLARQRRDIPIAAARASLRAGPASQHDPKRDVPPEKRRATRVDQVVISRPLTV